MSAPSAGPAGDRAAIRPPHGPRKGQLLASGGCRWLSALEELNLITCGPVGTKGL